MENKEKIKSIIKDLMEQLYEAKGFDNLHCNPLERNILEAEMQKVWDEFETYLALDPDECEEYEDEIEELEGKIDELIDRNCALVEENEKLWERLKEISKVVNDTWC